MKLKLSLFRDVHSCKLNRGQKRRKHFVSWLKSTCLPWAWNHSTRTHFLSPRSLQVETERKAYRYPHSIHPFSKFNTFREGVMLVMTVARLITNEFSFIYLDRPFCFNYWICKLFVINFINLMFFLNIILNFFTGYVERNTKLVQLGRKQIVTKYLTTYFLLDFVIYIPWNFVWSFLMYRVDILTYLYLNLLSRFILGMSVIRISSYFHTLGQALGISKITRNVIWSQLFLVLLSFFISPFVYIVYSQIEIGNVSDVDKYYDLMPGRVLSFSMYSNFGCYLSIVSLGQRAVRPVTSFSFRILIKILLVTLNLYGYMHLIASVVILYQNMYTKNLKYFEWYYKVKAFLKKHRVKKKQRKQLAEAFESKYFTGLHWDRNILEMLGESIIKAVAVERCSRFFARHPILRLMTEDNMVLAGRLLEEEVYLKKEVVFQIGAEADSMYYMNCGRASAFYRDGSLAIEFGSGDFFGEVALHQEEAIRNLKVVTTDICYFLVLTKYNFEYVLSSIETRLDQKSSYFTSRRDFTTVSLDR